ncbi:hypothetical protein GWI33_015798 [Rhynchophorus ferrugineus]|uniref:Uncharacterized protein n=1 Tax=Rhynchophorus ferrugineus TaxID=354439 RepID=A0A834I2T3_RHYFE|nr:hypothetical protein GWI33_015798 [Rhynchophorus ferrugineus]
MGLISIHSRPFLRSDVVGTYVDLSGRHNRLFGDSGSLLQEKDDSLRRKAVRTVLYPPNLFRGWFYDDPHTLPALYDWMGVIFLDA